MSTEAPIEPYSATSVQNRWLVVLAAIVLNLTLGALYSWPVFSNYLVKLLPAAERWNNLQAQLVFSMATVFLAVGVIVAGQLSERYRPRTLIRCSALFTGGGYVLGGVLPLQPVFGTATIGVMVGFGIGMAYALPISLAAKWFPDRKGLVTGLAMAGFGVGSVVWSQSFDLLLAHLLGIRLTFVLYGVVFGLLILGTTRFLINPPSGYSAAVMEGAQRARAERTASGAVADAPLRSRIRRPEGAAEFAGSEILTHHQLYFLVYTFMVGSAVGLMIIGMSKTYPIERLMASGYSAATATGITRLAALVLFPIFNGNGRVVFGWLSDYLGWKPVIVASYTIQALVVAAFPWLMTVPAATLVALPLLAMCYGGNFTIFPVATSTIWGPKHLAANYSLVFVAFGVGALVGPPLAGAAKDAGLITAAYLAAGGLLAVGAILTALVRPRNTRE